MFTKTYILKQSRVFIYALALCIFSATCYAQNSFCLNLNGNISNHLQVGIPIQTADGGYAIIGSPSLKSHLFALI